MNKQIAHVHNYTPRHFRVFATKIISEEIGCLSNNHQIIDYSMKALLVGLHLFVCVAT